MGSNRFRRSSHTLLLLLALTLACAGAANANSFQIGAFVTNTQSNWADITTNAGAALSANFSSVYSPQGGGLIVGSSSAFYMLFTDALSVQMYLPTTGAPGSLTNSFIDPLTSPSGQFGGEVVALKLNIDFENAGFLLGVSGVPFGNLVLTNFGSTLSGLNGLTVSQFLADDNTCLGGGSCLFTISTMNTVTADLNNSFSNGTPSTFADTNLALPGSVTPTPEPSSLLLFGTGLLGLGFFRRRLWSRP
jgi:hypothetical protein